MTRHILKMVWNRKRANALIVAEIFVSFLVIFAVLTGAITLVTNWRRPIGFSWQNVWDVSMEFDIDGGQQAKPELHAAVMRMASANPSVASSTDSQTFFPLMSHSPSFADIEYGGVMDAPTAST